MKVTLDLAKLLHDGAITQDEHDRLARLGHRDTGLLLVNILIGFGVLAVAGGCLAVLPHPLTGLVLGALLLAPGLALLRARREQWTVLANICILLGALLLGAGIILLSQGVFSLDGTDHPPPLGFGTACLLVATLFAAAAALARSSLLTMLAVLMLFAVLGSGGGYSHAFYELQVRQPFITVAAFMLLALAAHAGSRRVGPEWERLLTTVARTAVFLVNLGFWVGSLWGDDLDWLPNWPGIPALAFSLAWAAALLATGLWAGLANRRWVLNLVAVFAGIHFYTQWFERLGATPGSVLAAGVLVLVFAVVLRQINRAFSPPGP